MEDPQTITITGYATARDAYRQKALRQALYDAGEVIMADVIVNLHGDEHRSRRRLENRLFRRDRMEDYEKRRFPQVIEETISPHVEAGGCELVTLSHQLMMNLAATTAGVDRPLGTPEETFHLYGYLMTFIEGATLAHYTGDKEAKAAEVAAQLEAFDAEFLTPSIARRRRALDAAAAGEIDGSEVPVDVLTTLLRNEDDLHLPHETIRRETAFYLLAGAHTSATAFVRTLHRLFSWEADHPEEADVIRTDPVAVQRCMHETIRLEPSSPVAMRWALEDITLRDGTEIPKGARVVIDLTSVNRDPEVFGEDAQDFNPHRELPDGVSPWGLSFGSGMHACIGQDLAGGLPFEEGDDIEEHLHGLVPVAVMWMLNHGARPVPDDPPQMDTTTARPYWGSYPVRFA
jgi:cytochrome P450